MDPLYRSFQLALLSKAGMQQQRKNGRKEVIDISESDEDKDPQSESLSRNLKKQDQAVRKNVNGREKDIRKKNQQDLSNKKSNAKSSNASMGIHVDVEALSESEDDEIVYLGSKFGQGQNREVDKGKNAIKVGDPANQSINKRLDPKKKGIEKNQLEQIAKAPSNAKHKGHSSQKSSPRNNQLPEKPTHQVGEATPAKRGLRKPGARTHSVAEKHFERRDQDLCNMCKTIGHHSEKCQCNPHNDKLLGKNLVLTGETHDTCVPLRGASRNKKVCRPKTTSSEIPVGRVFDRLKGGLNGSERPKDQTIHGTEATINTLKKEKNTTENTDKAGVTIERSTTRQITPMAPDPSSGHVVSSREDQVEEKEENRSGLFGRKNKKEDKILRPKRTIRKPLRYIQ